MKSFQVMIFRLFSDSFPSQKSEVDIFTCTPEAKLSLKFWRHYFDTDLFLLSSLVTGPSFMSISWLILELYVNFPL